MTPHPKKVVERSGTSERGFQAINVSSFFVWLPKELITIDWLPAREAKSHSITMYLPTPAFSLLRNFKAELYYEGPEDALTVSEEVELYVTTFFEQVGGG